MSRAQEMLDLLGKWVLRTDFDDCSEEAINDNFRMQNESVFMNGTWKKVRRIFVSVRGAKSYERVGWIVNADVSQCMVCCSQIFEGKYHCAGCGNIVCAKCSPEEGVIFELSSAGPLRVCLQCYYGQDPVYAIIHEDVVLAPFIVKRNNSYKQFPVVAMASTLTPAQGQLDVVPPPVESPIAKGHHVNPMPKLVLKTRLSNSDRKVFINICGHEDVPQGRAIAAELAKEGTENSGQQCLIFDVTCCLQDVEEALDDVDGPSEALHKICVQAMFVVKKLFKQTLRDEYTLPKIRNNYKGEMVQQVYIPADLRPVIAPPQAKEKIQELKAQQDVLDKQLIAAMRSETDEFEERESLAAMAQISEEEDRVANEVRLMREAIQEAEEEKQEIDRAEAEAAAARQVEEAEEVERLLVLAREAEEESKRQRDDEARRDREEEERAERAQAEHEAQRKKEREAARLLAVAAEAAQNSDDDEAEPPVGKGASDSEGENSSTSELKKDQNENEEKGAKEGAKENEKLAFEENARAQLVEEKLAEEKLSVERREKEFAAQKAAEAAAAAEKARLAALPKEKRVVATPATVIKTREATGDGKKVFVNVLVHPDVAEDQYGFGDEMKEMDGFLVFDVCCNEKQHDHKMTTMDDDPDIMLEVYAKMIDALSKRFNHPLQRDDLRFPKTRNNYKSASGTATPDECSIPIGQPPLNGTIAEKVVAAVTVEPATPPVPPPKAGWLKKEGHSLLSSWKKRYFVLTDGTFGYFGDESLAKQYGNVALNNAGLELVEVKGVKRLVISTASGTLYKLEGAEVAVLREWMESLERHIAYATTMTLLNGGENKDRNASKEGGFFRRMASRGSFSRQSQDSIEG